MTRLLAAYPSSIAESLFTSDIEGWSVVSYPGAPNPRTPVWEQRDASNGACRYTPAAQETAYYFSAPAALLGDRAPVYGGVIAYAIEFGATAPVTLAASANLVLQGAGKTLTLDTSRANFHTVTGVRVVVITPVMEGNGWLDGGGQPATKAAITEVLGALTALLIRGDAVAGATHAELDQVELYADPRPSLQPKLTVVYQDNKLQASWPASPYAGSYRVDVKDAQKEVVYTTTIDAASFALPVTLASGTFTPQEGQTYTVDASLVSIPGEQAVTIPSAFLILTALRDRLLAHRPSAGAIVFDDFTLPASGTGDPARVLAALSAALGAASISVTTPADPVLTNDSLTIDGTADLLGTTGSAVHAVFTVTGSKTLEITLRVTPAAGWVFSDSFPDLAETDIDTLAVSAPAFLVTTVAHTEPGVFFPLTAGLSFLGELSISSSLKPVTAVYTPADLQKVAFGGAVQPGSAVLFQFTGAAKLAPLTLAPLDRPALTLKNGALSLTRAMESGAPVERLSIRGKVAFAGVDRDASLEVPSGSSPSVTLSITGATMAKVGDAVSAVSNATDVTPYLPTSLIDLAALTINSLTIAFDPSGKGPSVSSLGLGSTASWTFASGGVALSGFTFELKVRKSYAAAGVLQTVFSGSIGGTVTLGETPFAVELALSTDTRWYLSITDTSNTPTLELLARLLQIDTSGLIPSLPPSLQTLYSVSLNEVILGGDPFAQTLDLVQFKLSQKEPWIVSSKITVSGWAITVSVVNATGNWEATGLLEGKVKLGTDPDKVPLDVSMPIPPGEGEYWQIALGYGEIVHIPTIGKITEILASGPVAGPGALPQGISTLGGLDVTAFAVSFDPAGPTLKHVGFAFQQSSTWTILPDALSVSGVQASFSLLSTNTGISTLGFASGILQIASTPVDVNLEKVSFDAEWVLQIAAGEAVRLPGLPQLASWMAPTQVAAYLPSNLPFSKGIDVSNVSIRFGGGTGTLNEVSFQIGIEDVWTVIPGKLSLTDLSAAMTLPYPISTDTLSGSVDGLFTLAGAPIRLGAAKPSGGSPWTFSGALESSVTLDLVAAANQVSTGAAIALPGDITSFGFPSEITIVSAEAEATPDTGAFHFAGLASFRDWSFEFGVTQLEIRSIGGEITVESTGKPLQATITGAFTFASLDAAFAIQLGGAGVDTVLVGTLTPAKAKDVVLSSVADKIAASATDQNWAQITPPSLAPLTFDSAAVAINLTKSVFVLYGNVTGLASGYLISRKTPIANTSPQTFFWEYLFAARLSRDFQFARLLSALSVVDEVLTVKSASLVVYSVGDGGVAGIGQAVKAFGPSAPQVTWPLTTVQETGITAKRGLIFAGQLDFTAPKLFGKVLQIGTPKSTASVDLLAVVDRDDLSKSLFSAGFPDLTILSTISLTGIRATYTPANDAVLTLGARLGIDAIFGKNYGFLGDLTLTSTAVSGSLDLDAKNPDKMVAAPFGVPGITISALKAKATYTFAFGQTPATSSFSLQGQVLFGRPPTGDGPDQRLSFTTDLALTSGSPMRMLVTLDKDLAIGDFFAQTLTGDGATWPGTFIDLAFLTGSRIYYLSASAGADLRTDGKYTFQNGFNVDALVRLTFITSIDLRFTLQAVSDVTGKYEGVTADAARTEPIDLIFLQLAGTTLANGVYTGGPALRINTVGTPKFGFVTGLNFLGTAFSTVDIAVSKDTSSNTVVDGKIATAATLVPFGALSLDFTYTFKRQGENQFRIKNWPSFDWVRNIIDVVNEVKKLSDASNKPGCDQLVGFVTSALSTKFTIKPSVGADGDTLDFNLTGSVAMFFGGSSISFLSVDLPPLVISVPKTTKYADLPNALATGIFLAGPTLARALLKNPDKIALFLAVLFAKDAVSYAATLACKALVDAAVKAATAAAVDAIASAGGVVAGGAAAILAGIGAIGAILGGGGGDGGEDPPPKPATPTLTFDGSSLGISWQTTTRAQSYAIVLKDAAGKSTVPASGLTGSRTTVAASSLSLGQTYAVQIRALGKGGWSALSDAATLFLVAAPTGVSATFADPTLTASWTAPAGTLTGYQVDLLTQAGAPVQPAPSVHIQGTTATVTDALFASAGSFGVCVRATTVSATSPWSATFPFTLTVLPAPSGLSLLTDAGEVVASWTAITGASYTVVVLNAAGAPLSPQPTIHASGASARISGAGIVAGARIQVKAKATAAFGIGTFSAPVALTIVALSKPALPTLVYASGALTASWTSVTGAAGYEVDMLVEGNPPTPPLTIVHGPTQATITGAALAAGKTVTVAVRALAPSARSAWSDRASIVLLQLAAPAGLSLQNGAAAITASWSAAPPASAYELAVLQGGRALVPQPLITINGTRATINATSLQTGETYQVEVRSRTPAVIGPYSAPTSIVYATTETPAQVATRLAAARLELYATALGVHAAFPTLSAADLATALLSAFSNATAILLAVALQRTDYPENDAAAGLKAAVPATGAVALAVALKTAYPAAAVLALAVQRKAAGDTAAAAASAVKQANPELNATQLAVVLQQIFTAAVAAAAPLATALKGASIAYGDAAVAVRTLFPSITAAELAAVLKQVFQP